MIYSVRAQYILPTSPPLGPVKALKIGPAGSGPAGSGSLKIDKIDRVSNVDLSKAE
jgi:hypothetical protein